MAHDSSFTLEGGCVCGEIRYRVTREPFIVHCCNCTYCQRETGSAFALNALVESAHVEMLKGTPETINTPSASGKGQKILRCPTCKCPMWSYYSGFDESVSFIRVGSTAEPHRLPPDIYIYTSTKLPWVKAPEGVPECPEFYDPKETWSDETWKRVRALRER